jgi:hypothetical protein
MSRIFVLELTDPQGDGRIRAFARRDKAERVARRWTGAKEDTSAWRGSDGREDYDADLYVVTIEP